MTKFTEFVERTRIEIIARRERAFRLPFLSDNKEFKEIADYYHQSHGKLLRPLLCVAFADALGGSHDEALILGTAVEQIHAGSLMHDDIIDGDLFRRGLESVHERFGVIPAILFGDQTIVTGVQAIRTLPPEHAASAFIELTSSLDRLTTGANKEHKRAPWDIETYMDVISLKTATAFRAAARLGTIAASSSNDTRDVAGNVGEHIGVAFQIGDDITDILKSIRTGKPTGDVLDGKTTLPIIHLKSKYPELEKEFIRYEHGVQSIDEIPGIIEHIEEGMAYAHQEIDARLQKANELADLIPLNNGMRYVLNEYGRYAVNSILSEA